MIVLKEYIGEHLKWFMLGAAAILFVIYLAVAAINEPEHDDVDCPLPLKAHTALLVDRSDPYSQRQTKDGRQMLENLLMQLAIDERFSHYEITGSVGISPETPSVTSKANTVAPTILSTKKENSRCRIPLEEWEFSNTALYSVNEQRQKAETFKKKWEELGKHLFPEPEQLAPRGRVALTPSDYRTLTSRETADSPIFEYIKQVGDELHKRKALKKRLIIVSDLGQNVTGFFNICETLPSFEAFRNTEYYREVAPDLTGVTVDIYYIQRLGIRRSEECNATLQKNPQHKQFWRHYLTSAGATLGTFHTLLE